MKTLLDYLMKMAIGMHGNPERFIFSKIPEDVDMMQ